MSEIIGKVRASSWGELFDCSLRWYYKNVEGLRFPPNGASQIGTAIHRGTAVFDRSRMGANDAPLGVEVTEAVDAAADAIDQPVNEEGKPVEVLYDEELKQGQAKDFAVQLTSKYCHNVGLHKTYSAIELKCVALDVTTEHGVVRLSGTTDRIETRAKDEGITDFKSGATAVGTDGVAKTAGHHLQLGVYTLMSEQELKRPLGAAHIMGFQTSSKLRIGEGSIEQPKLALVGNGENPGLIELAAAMLKRGEFPPNPKSMLCSKKWCPAWDKCIYHA